MWCEAAPGAPSAAPLERRGPAGRVAEGAGGGRHSPPERYSPAPGAQTRFRARESECCLLRSGARGSLRATKIQWARRAWGSIGHSCHPRARGEGVHPRVSAAPGALRPRLGHPGRGTRQERNPTSRQAESGAREVLAPLGVEGTPWLARGPAGTPARAGNSAPLFPRLFNSLYPARTKAAGLRGAGLAAGV